MAAPKKTMRALQYDKYGGGAEGLKHVDVPVPSPNKGEVLLKLEAASINPIDWKIQKGMVRPFLPRKFPFIPVGDISGEVVELGSGVTNFKPGDKVISISFATGGGLAEYAVAPASHTVARPPEVSAAEGASLPTAASTALQQLKAAGVSSFDGGSGSGSGADSNGPRNVLVTAASGGVGHYAVQLAKLAGLHVTATCGARRRGGALRDGHPVVGVRAGSGRQGHGRRRHPRDRRGSQVVPAEGDLRQEEAGATGPDPQEGGDGVAGGHDEAREAQDGDRLQVPVEQSAGGVGEEHGRACHRQDRCGNGRRRVNLRLRA